MYALINSHLHTGFDVFYDHAVIIENDKIAAIIPESELDPKIEKIDLNRATLCAGFIDLQLNGCGGVQFNENLNALSIKTLEIMQETNLKSGCSSYLPTLITSTDDFMKKAIEVMRDYLKTHENQALGLHLEGPYISKAKKGTHNVNLIRKPTQEMIDFLCKNADVIKIITLAPEEVDEKYIRQLSEAGILVSTGHSNGTYENAKSAYSAGSRFATHLFNAMSGLSGREPGIIGAVFDSPEVATGIIADGHHVSYANIRNAKRIKGEKLILVTDAILAVGTNLKEFQFAGKTIYYNNGVCVDENGTLSGAAITMIESIKNCVQFAQFSLDDAIKMATIYPAKAIKIDDKLGSISVNKIANLVAFDDKFNITKMIINGKLCN